MLLIPRRAAIAVTLLAGLVITFGNPPAAAQQTDPYYPPPPGAQPGSPYPPPPAAQPVDPYAPPPADGYGAQSRDTYSAQELIKTGHGFFGKVSEGLASVVEHAVANYGLPNGYILGQEGAGAIVGGLRYGEGTLHTKNAGQHPIFWQGPSIGFDVGAEGNRTMMLVYNLPSIDAVHERFVGVAGSAYLVAGVGMTVLTRQGIYVVPIVSGVGARLGVNVGYLKFTPKPTWNPF